MLRTNKRLAQVFEQKNKVRQYRVRLASNLSSTLNRKYCTLNKQNIKQLHLEFTEPPITQHPSKL